MLYQHGERVETVCPRCAAGETLVRHDFTGPADRTTVVTHLRYATAQGRDTVLRYPMTRGLGEAFDRLAAVLHTDSTTGATT